MPTTSKKSSMYGAKENRLNPRKPGTLRLSKQMIANLPYKSIPKDDVAMTAEERAMKEKKLGVKKMSAYDKLVAALINRASALKNARLMNQREQLRKKVALKEKEEERKARMRQIKERESKKSKHVHTGKTEAFARKRLRLQD